MRLEYNGETREQGVLFFDWQFVSAPTCFVLLLLLIATQPFRPAPLWRSIMVNFVGLGIMTTTIVIEATQWKPWAPVWRSKSIDQSPPLVLHLILAATVLSTGLALSILGALGIRACLLRKARAPAAVTALNEKA